MADGTKVVLGLWLEQNEGAKFWLRVINELRNRGVEDIMLAVVDGLKGFPDTITAVFPEAMVQTCIVHLLRNSMDFVAWKDRKALGTALKAIYRAVDAAAAETLEAEWSAGCRIGAELRPRLKASGFAGSQWVVSEWATHRRRDKKLVHTGGAGLSARTIARSMTTERENGSA